MTRDEEPVDYFEVAKEIVMAETRAIKIERITKELEELLWEDVLERERKGSMLNCYTAVIVAIAIELDDLTEGIKQQLIDRLEAWRDEQADKPMFAPRVALGQDTNQIGYGD